MLKQIRPYFTVLKMHTKNVIAYRIKLCYLLQTQPWKGVCWDFETATTKKKALIYKSLWIVLQSHNLWLPQSTATFFKYYLAADKVKHYDLISHRVSKTRYHLHNTCLHTFFARTSFTFLAVYWGMSLNQLTIKMKCETGRCHFIGPVTVCYLIHRQTNHIIINHTN